MISIMIAIRRAGAKVALGSLRKHRGDRSSGVATRRAVSGTGYRGGATPNRGRAWAKAESVGSGSPRLACHRRQAPDIESAAKRAMAIINPADPIDKRPAGIAS